VKNGLRKKRMDNTRTGILAGATMVLRNPSPPLGSVVIALLVLTAVFAPYMAPIRTRGRGLSNLKERLVSASIVTPARDGTISVRDILSRVRFWGTNLPEGVHRLL